MTLEAESAVPISLDRSPTGGLEIGWSDGKQQTISVQDLQEHCPCATCREKRKAAQGQGPSLTILAAEPNRDLAIVTMAPVGNYAYSISFSEGCSKGIYTFELLRRLG